LARSTIISYPQKLEHTKQSTLAEKEFKLSNNFTSKDNSIHVSGIRNVITLINRKGHSMENQEQNDLIVVVEQQKTFIINYLKHLNLKIKKMTLVYC
jgi:hypothetical protein